MRVATLFKIIVVTVAALVVCLYAILQSQDFSQYRGLIEEQARAATGRQLVLAGELNLRLLTLSPALKQAEPAPGEGFGKDLEGLGEGLNKGLKGLFN